MEQRRIPDTNLLLLETVDNERCNREEYEKAIAAPVPAFLADKPRINCLVLLYGMPLRIKDRLVSGPNHTNNRMRDQGASDGDFTLVEAYQLRLPFISWKMVLSSATLFTSPSGNGVFWRKKGVECEVVFE